MALLLSVPVELEKSLQTTNVYILLSIFYMFERSGKYVYLSIF